MNPWRKPNEAKMTAKATMIQSNVVNGHVLPFP
jgi:hypothetical protein